MPYQSKFSGSEIDAAISEVSSDKFLDKAEGGTVSGDMIFAGAVTAQGKLSAQRIEKTGNDTSDNDVMAFKQGDGRYPRSPDIRTISVVSSLPSSPNSNTLYLIKE